MASQDKQPAARRTQAQSKQRPAPAAKDGDNPQPRVLAMVYDFDGTLSPRPMQEYSFLPQIGEDPKAFWAEVDAMSREHQADNLITYMHLMYRKAKARGIRVDRADLVAQGRDVELFPGVEAWFAAIKDYVAMRAETPVEVRHYLISSGLKEIIEGTRIYSQFHNVFASEYFFEAYETPFPKRVITDTGKTQYLFRINKGVEDLTQTINSHMPEKQRPVPFQHMVYFGDGDTDVPSMTVMRKNGGHAIAVHGEGPEGERGEKKCAELFRAGRVDFYAPADYRRGSTLFKRTGLVLDHILAVIRIEEERDKLERSWAAPAAERG